MDYVDLLSLELVDDVLDPYSSQAYAGADGVDAVLAGVHGHLASRARLARNGLDLHDAVEYLRHFHLEQATQEVLVSAGDHYLRAAAAAAYLCHVHLELLARPVSLRHDLLRRRQNGLSASQVQGHLAGVGALHGGGDNIALFFGVLFVDKLPLRLSQSL